MISTVCMEQREQVDLIWQKKEVSWLCSMLHHPKAPLLVGINDSPVSAVYYNDNSFQETVKDRVIVFLYGYAFYASCGIKNISLGQ